jgi:glutamyl-tRNA synthetase
MTVFVRFAPSPTGYVHVGNIRTALVNWLFARKQGGRFMLRLDDTDTSRSKQEYAECIEQDMRWLGMEWDDFARQSDRYDRYELARDRLIANGRLYPCYETQEELDIRRKMQSSRGLPPIYDRAALKLSEEQKKQYEAEGRKPHYRFLLEDKDIVWQDMVRGEARFRATHMSDPVLIREDGVPLYTLASVVDDGEMGVTHIIRGEDHVSNTAVQFQIFEALGYTPPTFAHLALMKTKEGEISKRLGGFDIRSLREAGFESLAVVSLLAKIGTSDPIEAFDSMDALVESFDIGKFGRAPANYDEVELQRLNARIVSHLSYEAVKSRLEALGLKEIDAAFWDAVRPNLTYVKEVGEWWALCRAAIQPDIEDAEFTRTAADLLPPEPWDTATWKLFVEKVKENTGRKGKLLFMPLRKALTGLDHGPELDGLFPLIGRERAIRRLKGEAA